nr:ribonuclease H-like domain, reverse transcriptase, RNA-dependent DNA polymerase [Tanacetum cinerariifolium]
NTLKLQKDWYHKTQLALEEKVRILSANLENTINTLKYTETLYDQAKIEKKEWEVKLIESLARFDKWKESSKNLVKLINSSMSSRTKLGLGFKETIGADEVFDLSTPSVFDPKHENREVESLYERFVKAGEIREVRPPITGTFMPTSYKSDLEETQETFGLKSNTSSINTSESNDFVSCDNSDKSSESETSNFASCVSRPKTNDSSSTIDVKILPKSDVKDPSLTNGIPSCSFNENVKPLRNLCNKSGIADRIHCKNSFVHTKTCFVCGIKTHLIKDCDVYDNVPSVVLKAAYVPAGSRNSSSISAGRSIPAASRNRPASIHTGRRIPAGRFNKPASFPVGRSVPTGWTNHAGRPFFRPTNLYFDNVFWPGIYDHMSMNEGRWGSVVKSSAELASPEQTTTGKDVSNPFISVMVCQKPLGYFSSPMIHVPRAGLVIHPSGLKIYPDLGPNKWIQQSTLMVVDPNISTQADRDQSSLVLVPLSSDPYEVIRHAYLVGTDTESKPFEAEAETPESHHIVAPPTCHVEESKGSGTFGARSTSLDSIAPLSPNHPLNHTTPALDPILCRIVRMAVRVPPAMSPGLSAGIAEVAAMSDSAFHKKFRTSYDNSPSLTLPDEGPTEEDEDPAAGDEGLAAGDEGLVMGFESHGLDDESYVLDNKVHSVKSDGFVLGEEEAVHEGQQQAVLVVETAISEPLGFGYGALRRQELALEGDHVYNMFEVGQGSGSACETARSERVSVSNTSTICSDTAITRVVVWFISHFSKTFYRSFTHSITHDITHRPITYSFTCGYLDNHHPVDEDQFIEERTAVTFGALWRPVLALEAWVGHRFAAKAIGDERTCYCVRVREEWGANMTAIDHEWSLGLLERVAVIELET